MIEPGSNKEAMDEGDEEADTANSDLEKELDNYKYQLAYPSNQTQMKFPTNFDVLSFLFIWIWILVP